MEERHLTEEQEARLASVLEEHLKELRFRNIKITTSTKTKGALDIVCTGTGEGNAPIAHKGVAVLQGDNMVLNLKPCWGLTGEDHARYSGMFKEIGEAIDKANKQEGTGDGTHQGGYDDVEEHGNTSE